MDEFVDFDDLMANARIGDFTGFVLSNEERAAEKKARVEQIKSDIAEIEKIIESAEAEGRQLNNKEVRRVRLLSSDRMVRVALSNDEYTVEDIVDIEYGDKKINRDEPKIEDLIAKAKKEFGPELLGDIIETVQKVEEDERKSKEADKDAKTM